MKFFARKGFTLIELLVVISIIAILSIIGMVVFTNVLKMARSQRVKADFDAMYKNIEQARIFQQKTLPRLTGNNCSECVCRRKDANECLDVMTSSYAKITSAPLPKGPWGRPYMFDENEGEEYPRGSGIVCRKDVLLSAGPDYIR